MARDPETPRDAKKESAPKIRGLDRRRSVVSSCRIPPAVGGCALVALAVALAIPDRILSQATVDSAGAARRIDVPDITGSVSRGGQLLSYTDWSTGDIAVWDVATGESRRVTNKGSWFDSPELGFPSVMSPDGRKVAYSWSTREGTREIRVAALDSGASRTLYRSGRQHAEPQAWFSDGTRLLVTVEGADGNTHVVVLDAATGTVTVIAALPGYDLHLQRMSLGDGDTVVAFDLTADEVSRSRDVVLLSLYDGALRSILPHPANDLFLGWSPDGAEIVFASDRSGTWDLWTAPWGSAAPGALRRLARDIGPVVRSLGTDDSGRVYFGRYAYANYLYTASLSGRSPRLRDIRRVAPLGADAGAAWSRNGRYLAYVTGFGYPPDPFVLRLRDTDSGVERAVTLPFGAHPFRLSWSPADDCLLAHDENRRGQHAVHCVHPLTGRVTTVVPRAPCCFESPTWSAEHGVILRRRSDVGDPGRVRIVSHDPATGNERDLYVTTPPTRVPDVWDPIVSPDGGMLAVIWMSWADRVSAVRVVPLDGSPPRDVVRVAHPQEVTAIAWMPDSRSLVYAVAHEGGPSELWLTGGEAQPQRIGSVQERTVYDLDVHPAGDRIAISAGTRGWDDQVWVVQPFARRP